MHVYRVTPWNQRLSPRFFSSSYDADRYKKESSAVPEELGLAEMIRITLPVDGASIADFFSMSRNDLAGKLAGRRDLVVQVYQASRSPEWCRQELAKKSGPMTCPECGQEVVDGD